MNKLIIILIFLTLKSISVFAQEFAQEELFLKAYEIDVQDLEMQFNNKNKYFDKRNHIAYLKKWKRGLSLEKNNVYKAKLNYLKALDSYLIERSTYEVHFSIGRLFLIENKSQRGINSLQKFIKYAKYRIERVEKSTCVLFCLDEKQKKIFQDKINLSEKLIESFRR
ncbi:hypothetical protein [Seonamhaeicola maritimus]|uniref:hypothetical protein n=1 Tax=Seonamhaeicola maritimus TaxID=2591822 RepID=UPI002493FD88|nr:hypothetical protein [Seonamhaeicola maritimus]